MTSSTWSAISPMDLPAKTSGCALASATVSGSSGQLGVNAVYPFFSKSCAHRSQLLGSSHRPWTNTTGTRPAVFARSTCSASYSVIAGRCFVPMSVNPPPSSFGPPHVPCGYPQANRLPNVGVRSRYRNSERTGPPFSCEEGRHGLCEAGRVVAHPARTGKRGEHRESESNDLCINPIPSSPANRSCEAPTRGEKDWTPQADARLPVSRIASWISGPDQMGTRSTRMFTVYTRCSRSPTCDGNIQMHLGVSEDRSVVRKSRGEGSRSKALPIRATLRSPLMCRSTAFVFGAKNPKD